MIRKLLLLLVVITILQNTSYSQEATVLGNCYYDNTQGRIVIRLAIRNNTASASDFELVGIRFGIQYNPLVVSPAGYRSYMHDAGDVNSSLNGSADFIPCIGEDTDGGGYTGSSFSVSSNPAETSRVAYNADSTLSKVMNRAYINRSSNLCSAAWIVPPQTYRVAIDIYFTLIDPSQLSFYNLNTPGYGFDSPNFIAQSMNSHTANLASNKSEIAIVLIRNGNCNTNPYQPFSKNSCANDKVNPVTIDGDTTVRFITPINGVLAGKATNTFLTEKNNNVIVDWETENNELVDYYEVQRKNENGEFKTIGLVMSDNKNSTVRYQFKDKITARDIESYYRIKVIGADKVTTYGDVKKIRLSSEQQISVKVFPNPSSETIRINLPQNQSTGVYVCRMYSTEGRMVQVTNVSPANPTVNIKTLQTGSYFMELYQPQSGKRFYTQFSKQ